MSECKECGQCIPDIDGRTNLDRAQESAKYFTEESARLDLMGMPAVKRDG